MSATYRYPPYTRLGETTVELRGGVLEGPQYTNVKLIVATAARVETAFVTIGARKIKGTTLKTEAIASAKNVALLASRTNTMLSIPMLLGMTAYAHGLPL